MLRRRFPITAALPFVAAICLVLPLFVPQATGNASSPPPAPSAPGPQPDLVRGAGPAWLARFNEMRGLANLPPVVESTALDAYGKTWSQGDVLHATYSVKTQTIGHTEDPNSPYFTPSGNLAAQNGNVAAASDPARPDTAFIDQWLTESFHMGAMMNPRLTATGFGSFASPGAGTFQSAATLDVLRGLSPNVQPSFPVLFPANGKTMPLLAYDGGEFPDPLTSCAGPTGAPYDLPTGPPLLVGLPSVPSVSAFSLMKDGRSLPVCEFDETNYTNTGDPGGQQLGRAVLASGHQVILLPRDPFTPGVYTASVKTGSQTITWTFCVGQTCPSGGPPTATPTATATATARTATATATGTATATTSTSTATRTATTSTGTPTRTATAPTSTATALPTSTVTATVTPTAATGLGNLMLISPFRAVDTRASDGGGVVHIGTDQNGNAIPVGPITAGSTRRFRLAFSGSPVPASATGVLLNVTIIGSPGGGYVTVFPGGDATPPLASTLNPVTPVAFNFWQVGVGPNALIGVYSTAQVDLAIDVVGFYSPANPSLGNLTLLSPFRAVDTRASDGGGITHIGVDQNGNPIPVGQVPAGGTRRFRLAFTGSPVPATATGVLLNVTLIGAPGGGYAVVFPGGDAQAPLASTLNPVTPVAFNFWAVKTGTNASIALFSTVATDVAIDVVGFYGPQPGNTGALTLISPFRTVDTRASDGGAIIHTGVDENGNPVPAAPIPAGATRRYRMSFSGSPVPADATGVLLNVTLIGAPGGGYAVVFPGSDAAAPLASTLNPVTAIAFNFWGSRVGPNGLVGVFSTNQEDLAIDVVGYFR